MFGLRELKNGAKKNPEAFNNTFLSVRELRIESEEVDFT